MNNKQQLLVLLIICFVAFFFASDLLTIHVMEARNFTTAREILETGDWLIPRMNGMLRLEKPPLPTWITAVVMYFFGQDDLGILRSPAGMSALLLIFFLYKFTRELTDKQLTPFLVAGTSSTSFYFLFMARSGTWDIFCHSFMLGAVWLFYKGFKRNNAWKEFTLGGILMGLSFMSKGPIAFYAMLLPFLIAYTVCYGKNPISNHWKPLAVALIITIIIGAWWPIYTYLTHPEFSRFIAEKESLAWLSRHVKPWHHYSSFPVQSGTWAIMSSAALIVPFIRKNTKVSTEYKFVAIWIWTGVILLSVFPEKKERYLLPILPPLAMLTGLYYHQIIDSFKAKNSIVGDRIAFFIHSILMAIISFGIPIAIQIFRAKGEFIIDGISFAVIVFVFSIIGFGFIFSLIKKKILLNWALMVALVCVAILTILPNARQVVIANPNYHNINKLRYDSRVEGMKFYHDPATKKQVKLSWNKSDASFSPFHFQDLMLQLMEPFPGRVALSTSGYDFGSSKFFSSGFETRYKPYSYVTPIRMELVWEVGRPLIAWHSEMEPFPFENTPFVFISQNHPNSIFPDKILDRYEMEYIDTYNNNRRKHHKSYGFINHVYIIREKTQKR